MMQYSYDLPNSSFITEISYDIEEETLTLMINEIEYVYYNVPAGLVAQLMFSDSASEVFNEQIKDQFEFEKLE